MGWGDDDDDDDGSLPPLEEMEREIAAKQVEKKERRESVERATRGYQEQKRDHWTTIYQQLIATLNATILPPPIQASAVDLNVDGGLIMVYLINTDSILSNLTGLHLSFAIGKPDGLHITFNVPDGWITSMLPNNAEHDPTDIRFHIGLDGRVTVHYRLGRAHKTWPKQVRPPHLTASFIYNTFVPLAARNTYPLDNIKHMVQQMVGLLRKTRTDIYANPELVILINTTRGGKKTRKRPRKRQRKTKGKKSKKRKSKRVKRKTRKHR